MFSSSTEDTERRIADEFASQTSTSNTVPAKHTGQPFAQNLRHLVHLRPPSSTIVLQPLFPRMALQRLSPADVEALASDTQPLLSSLPHRPRHRLGPRPPRPSRRTSAHRAQDRPYPVSRRMRRYHNDMRLAINAAETGALPTTTTEYRSLFERSSTSTWSSLHQDDDARTAWHRFVELSDDEQNRVLHNNHKPLHNRVDKTLKLLVKQRGPLVVDVVRQVEDKVVCLPPGRSCHLKMPHPLARMVAHRVAQFHSMKHQSVDIGSERVTIIHATKPIGPGPRLLDVLVA